VEINAWRKRGWSISAIARHVGRDRKTVRAYLSGEREAGVRVRAEADPFDAVEAYVRQRFADDPHVWATVLFDRSRRWLPAPAPCPPSAPRLGRRPRRHPEGQAPACCLPAPMKGPVVASQGVQRRCPQ
jgi:hypothetical protein